MNKFPSPGAIWASPIPPTIHPVLTSAASVTEIVPARLQIKALGTDRSCITDLLERDIHDLLTVADRRLHWVLILEAGTTLEMHDVCQLVALAKTLRDAGGGLTVQGLDLSDVPQGMRPRISELLGAGVDGMD